MGFLVFIVLFLAFLSSALHLIYIRHIKSYTVEINFYLKKRSLVFKQKSVPKITDWIEGPFEKPKSLSFVIIKVGNMYMSDEKYYILETSENRSVWLKIETTFLNKPKLTFKDKPSPKLPRTKNEIENQETYKCPACNYTIIETDNTCPDCGLSLK